MYDKQHLENFIQKFENERRGKECDYAFCIKGDMQTWAHYFFEKLISWLTPKQKISITTNKIWMGKNKKGCNITYTINIRKFSLPPLVLPRPSNKRYLKEVEEMVYSPYYEFKFYEDHATYLLHLYNHDNNYHITVEKVETSDSFYILCCHQNLENDDL